MATIHLVVAVFTHQPIHAAVWAARCARNVHFRQGMLQALYVREALEVAVVAVQEVVLLDREGLLLEVEGVLLEGGGKQIVSD